MKVKRLKVCIDALYGKPPSQSYEASPATWEDSVTLWNSLPDTVRLCNSTDAFKRHLKTHLFNLP